MTRTKIKNIFVSGLLSLTLALGGVTFCHLGGGAVLKDAEPSIAEQTTPPQKEEKNSYAYYLAADALSLEKAEVMEKACAVSAKFGSLTDNPQSTSENSWLGWIMNNVADFADINASESSGTFAFKDIGEQNISGDGTQENPFVIKTVYGFNYFMIKAVILSYSNPEKYWYAELGADLNFSGKYMDFGGYTEGTFYGHFDGNNHKMKGIVTEFGGETGQDLLPAWIAGFKFDENGDMTQGDQPTVFENVNFEVAYLKNCPTVEDLFAKTCEGSNNEVITANLEFVNCSIAQFDEELSSLKTAFADDIASWTNEDGSIKHFENPEDILGTGTQDDPFVVYSPKGWTYMVLKTTNSVGEWEKYYVQLGKDINFDEEGIYYDLWDTSYMEIPGKGFWGEIDGNGHQLTITMGSEQIGMFPYVGVSMSEQGLELASSRSAFKNMKINLETFTAQEQSFASMFGSYTINCDISNVEGNVFIAGENIGMTCGALAAAAMLTKVSDCDFNIASNEGISLITSVISPTMMGLTLEGVDNAITFERCSSKVISTQYLCGDVPGSSAYIANAYCPVSFKDCQASGYVWSSDDFYGTGGFVSMVDSAGYDDVDIIPVSFENCENRTTVAGKNAGGFVGSVDGDGLCCDLTFKNCANYGDVYAIVGDAYNFGIGFGNDIYAGGFLGLWEAPTYYVGETTLSIQNSQNYGNIYGGVCQAGFVGLDERGTERPNSNGEENVANREISNCANYGNLCYPVFQDFSFSGMTDILGGRSAGIINIAAGSISVSNCFVDCDFVQNTLEEYKQEGYYSSWENRNYGDNYVAMTTGAGIVEFWAIQSSSNYPAPSVKEVAINNCVVVANVKNYLMGFAGLVYGAIQSTNGQETFSANNCKVFITTENHNAIMNDSGQGSAAFFKLFLMDGDGPADSLTITNCYSENVVKGTNIQYFQAPADLQLTYSHPKNVVVDNIQVHLSADLSLMEPATTEVMLRAFSGSTMSQEYVTQQINNLCSSCLIICPEGTSFEQLGKGFSEFPSSNIKNAFLTIAALIPSTGEKKQVSRAIYDSESDEEFDSSLWFYDDNLMGGIPMLRQFFSAADMIENQNVIERVQSLTA